ncbi:glycosyltransferase [Chloroflexia bacterium SDU3-3]|nr:glycosyltransferase [Chloroflexia bacterium SDU3-3]
MAQIGILHYAGPPVVGGVEITMAAHARWLAAMGHSVRVIAGSGGEGGMGVETWLRPEFSSRGGLIELVNAELARGVRSAAYAALVDRIAGELADALAGLDVLMVHNVLTLQKNLALTAALHRLAAAGQAPRLLAWCHDFAWLDPLYTPELHAGEPWDLLRRPWPHTRYVVVSQDRRGMLAGLLGLPEDEITVVTPGVDLDALLKLEPETSALVRRLDLLHADPLLLLPARITRRKNIEAAVAITGALRAQGLAPRLVVTGPPGPHNPSNAAYLAQLQALRDATGDPASVVFLYESFCDAAGAPLPVSDAMLADFYRLADALLLPSRYEGFGIPVIEAGLVGMPIFASDIPPFHETAGDAALLFDLELPAHQVAERIAQAMRGDARLALRRRVRLAYTWEAIIRRDIEPLLA